jgi:hypothetical protein
MASITSKELNYSMRTNSHPSPIFREISTLGNSTETLSQNSSVGPIEISISPNVFNISKSILNLTLQVPAQGANNYSHVSANILSILDRVVLTDSLTNAVWCDISNISQYSEMIKVGTSFTDMMGKSSRHSSTDPATIGPALLCPVDSICAYKEATNNFNAGGTDSALDEPHTSVKNVYSSAANAIQFIRYAIPLSAFKMSVLALDKLLYNPSNLVLQLYLASTDNFGYLGTSATNPFTGKAAIAGNYVVSDISLSLCNEGNLSLVSQIIDKVRTEGIQLPISYPSSSRQTITASSAHSYQINLSSAYGARVLAIFTSVFEVGARNTRIHKRGTLSRYNTYIDNISIRNPRGYNIKRGEDYLVNKHYLSNSCVQNSASYANSNWIHIDCFVGDQPIHEIDMTTIDGFDLTSKMSTWQIQADYDGDVSKLWATIIFGQKMLILSGEGSQVM